MGKGRLAYIAICSHFATLCKWKMRSTKQTTLAAGNLTTVHMLDRPYPSAPLAFVRDSPASQTNSMTATKRCVSDLFLPCPLQCLQVDTSHYTDRTALPTRDEFSLSTPPDVPPIVIDDVSLQQKGDVQVQHISHSSARQSNSGE